MHSTGCHILDDHHILSVWHTLFKGCFSLCYCRCTCTYTNDLYFCLLQAACIEVLGHFMVDISLRYSVYLNKVEENKSVMHGHWFALVCRKLLCGNKSVGLMIWQTLQMAWQ